MSYSAVIRPTSAATDRNPILQTWNRPLKKKKKIQRRVFISFVGLRCIAPPPLEMCCAFTLAKNSFHMRDSQQGCDYPEKCRMHEEHTAMNNNKHVVDLWRHTVLSWSLITQPFVVCGPDFMHIFTIFNINEWWLLFHNNKANTMQVLYCMSFS